MEVKYWVLNMRGQSVKQTKCQEGKMYLTIYFFIPTLKKTNENN